MQVFVCLGLYICFSENVQLNYISLYTFNQLSMLITTFYVHQMYKPNKYEAKNMHYHLD